jgi:tetratricopeptide (TPR) repeat protein
MGEAGNSADRQPGETRRFVAFISYSHADAEAAAKFQRKLERYRLPKRIAQTRNRSADLGPIFRDREDLAAAVSLSAAIQDAISRADALVVLCSPHAAISPWVSAEIALFRSLNPDRPILAAVLSGNPTASFPPALTLDGNEPLAADLRPEGDGPQLGFLKVVAGIAGVPLDALIQRDAQRRIRRVTAITVGALAAMLIMGVMTVLAISARNEAAQQRAEAENMVEYMLTDLREKLKGVGRLDVMDAVNQQAMEHYRRQGDLTKLPADSLERRARVLHAMGEDDEKHGNLDAATKKFREAHRTTEALLEQQPKNADRIFAHAQSEYWLGYAALQRDDFVGAANSYRKYAEYGDRLAKIDPRKPEWLMEAGYGQQNMGTLSLQQGTATNRSTAAFRAAAEYFSKAIALQPTNSQFLIDLSEAEAWLADSLAMQQQHDDAIAARKRQRAILEQLIGGNEDNVDYRQRLLLNSVAIAQIEMDAGNPHSAVKLLGPAYEQGRRATSDDPTNAEIRKRARGIGLIYARALLLATPRYSSGEIATLMAPCNDNSLADDEQLMCATNRVRWFRANGDAGKALNALTRAELILKKIKRNGRRLRWGMDFDQEITVLSKLQEK